MNILMLLVTLAGLLGCSPVEKFPANADNVPLFAGVRDY